MPSSSTTNTPKIGVILKDGKEFCDLYDTSSPMVIKSTPVPIMGQSTPLGTIEYKFRQIWCSKEFDPDDATYAISLNGTLSRIVKAIDVESPFPVVYNVITDLDQSAS